MRERPHSAGLAESVYPKLNSSDSCRFSSGDRPHKETWSSSSTRRGQSAHPVSPSPTPSSIVSIDLFVYILNSGFFFPDRQIRRLFMKPRTHGSEKHIQAFCMDLGSQLDEHLLLQVLVTVNESSASDQSES